MPSLSNQLKTELHSSCEQDIWNALAPVTDPELDESVTELGFVTAVDVDGSDVTVEFHLPTFWCAANFAWLMASDMRTAVISVPWVKSVKIILLEHMFSDTINRGVASGVSFQETFGDEANGELDKLREKFRRKAFQQRQELLLRHLLSLDYSAEQLINLSFDSLSTLVLVAADSQRLLSRYLDLRQQWPCADELSDRAFITVDSEALVQSRFDEYLVELRGIRINTQFNGEICRGLLRARYGEAAPAVTEVKVDFPKPRSGLLQTQSHITGQSRTMDQAHD